MLGHIRTSRTIEELPFYTDGNVFRLFFHCLIKANYKPKKWNDITIQRGQFVSSLSNLADDLGLTVQNIRTAFKKLEKFGELTKVSTKTYTLITVCNYELYAGGKDKGNKDTNTVLTHDQHSTNTVLTTTKEGNKEKRKEESNIFLKEKDKKETPQDSPPKEDLKTKEEKKEKKVPAKKRKKFTIDELEFPPTFIKYPELKAAFLEFAEMRRQKGKPYSTKKGTETKLKALEKDVKRFGLENVIGAIEFATGAEYQGIFVQSYANNQEKQKNNEQTNKTNDGLTADERLEQQLNAYFDNNGNQANNNTDDAEWVEIEP